MGASCRWPDERYLFRCVQGCGVPERCALDRGPPRGPFAAPVFGHQCMKALRQSEDDAGLGEPLELGIRTVESK